VLLVPVLAAAALVAPPVTLTAADNGGVVRLARGAPVVVLKLAENPSTGYRWKLLAPLDSRVVKLVSHRYRPPPKGSLVGAPGVSVWRFKAVGSGRTVLRLGYLRSWQPRTVVKRYRITFRVS
jgi:predicted secreted protein